jgi:sterol 3beta-glucosyltransferase
MKIILPTIGTRGDLQPYIALALGLQTAGHTPILATHPMMRNLVEAYGLEFSPIGPDIDIGYEAAVIRGHSRNWMAGFMRVMKFSFAMLEKSHPELLEICRQADLIVISHSAAGSMEADMLGIPAVSVTLLPQAIPVQDSAQPLWKRTFGKIAGAGMGLVMTRPLNQIRERLGLGPMTETGITSSSLNLIPLSPHVSKPDPRWETRHRMTGYWFAPSPQTWSPPEELVQFLEAGEPPLAISLGAMAISGEDAHQAASITLDAIKEAGVRAIIQGWDEPLKTLNLPQGTFCAGAIPHDWLLQHCAGLIHHGGFGTTAAGFQAGIPCMAIPHIIDQFIWGQKIFELGVGPKPIARTKLAVHPLAEALRQLTQDTGMRSAAAELGRKIRSESGVKNAVDLILSSQTA